MKIDRYDAFIFEGSGWIEDRINSKKIIIFDFSMDNDKQAKECLNACMNVLLEKDYTFIDSNNEYDKKYNNTNPFYYNDIGLSPIEAFKQGLLTKEEYMGFLKGNIIKYSVRCNNKNLEEDMDKCQKYVSYLKDLLKNEEK